MFTEWRVRTVCELVINENYYLQPHIVSVLDSFGAVISKNALPATVSARVCHVPTVDIDFATSMLHSECIQTTKNGHYSCMWHVHALASVLRRPIVSIYPECNLRIRAMFDRECPPRIPYNKNHSKALIMLTRMGDSSAKTQGWSPNHFVAAVPCSKLTPLQIPISATFSKVPTVNSDTVIVSASQRPAFPTLTKEPTICSTTVSPIQFQSPASLECTVSSDRVQARRLGGFGGFGRTARTPARVRGPPSEWAW